MNLDTSESSDEEIVINILDMLLKERIYKYNPLGEYI